MLRFSRAVGFRGRIDESWQAFTQAFRRPELRRLQLAGVGSTLAVWANPIAIAVFAYRADGAKAVGLLLFVRWSLAAVFAPWLALLADRVSRRRVMLTVDLSRTALLAGIAATAFADGPAFVVYVLAVLASIVSTAFNPAEKALMPTLARTPDELTASNLALNTIASAGMFAGPAIGGLFLVVAGPWLVFALCAASFLWSAACVSGLPRDRPPEEVVESDVVAQLLGGFRAIGEDGNLRLVLALLGAQMLVMGAIEVVIVVDALRVLDAGNAAVGWLNTGLGVGGLAGGLVGVVLASRKRLAGDFRLGLVALGAAVAVLAATHQLAVALILFGLMGVGATLVDVTGTTLLQRSAPPAVVGRVFGVLQSLMLATVAVGSLVTPFVIAAVGPRATFVAVGLVLPVLVALTWRRVTAIDASAHVATEPLQLLRNISIFGLLPQPAVERLAAGATEVQVAAGADAVVQGASGDRFYVVADGEAAVYVDGAETSRLRTGDFFGEIALLRDVPRTATVTALEPLRLFAVERDDFIAAVTGHAPSREAADSVVAARLPAGAAR